MDLYYSPGACSLGIHVLMDEIGKPYGLKKVSLKDGEQYKPEFLSINPKAKVPTLVRDDGSVLTEFPAIASWLALTNPEKRLLPSDPEKHARTLEPMDYVVSPFTCRVTHARSAQPISPRTRETTRLS